MCENLIFSNKHFNFSKINLFFIGSSGDEESDSSRGAIPSSLDVPRGLQVIPLSPASDFYYNKDNSDKRVSKCTHLVRKSPRLMNFSFNLDFERIPAGRNVAHIA